MNNFDPSTPYLLAAHFKLRVFNLSRNGLSSVDMRELVYIDPEVSSYVELSPR